MFHFINAGNLIKFDRFHVQVWISGFTTRSTVNYSVRCSILTILRLVAKCAKISIAMLCRSKAYKIEKRLRPQAFYIFISISISRFLDVCNSTMVLQFFGVSVYLLEKWS